MIDNRFPKAPLFEIKWSGMPVKIGGKRRWKPLWHGGSNYAGAYLLFWHITWRMPWYPGAAYAMGWDACFRQLLPELQDLKEQVKELQGRN